MLTEDIGIEKDEFWWTFDCNKRQYYCSEAFAELCVLGHLGFSDEHFMALLHPKHKTYVLDSIKKYFSTGNYDIRFLVLTKYGYRWVNSKILSKEVNADGAMLVHGNIAFMDDKDVASILTPESEKHLDELIDRYSIISRSLMDLMYQKNISGAINQALNNLLLAFNGDRTYIFEYDHENKTQSCVYEMVSGSAKSEKDSLQNISIADTKWWTDRLLIDKSPIILDNINDLQEDAAREYGLLREQGVKSIMIMPLIASNNIRGYVGIDMVNIYYTWTYTDTQWFQSFANILSLCIDLKESEELAKLERERYINLYKYLPLGLIRLKLQYDENGKAIDYIVISINPMACSIFKVEEEDVLNVKATKNNDGNLDSKLVFFDDLVRNRGRVTNLSNMMINDCYVDSTLYSIEEDEVVVLVKDVTESTLASRALRKSEETLQNIYNNIPVGVEIYDKEGFLISINNKEKEIFGFDKNEDVLGINLFDNPNVPESFLLDLKEGRSSWCNFIYQFNKIEDYYESKKLGERHIMLRGAVLLDADCKIENYLLIVLDNTEFLETSHKLQKFELMFNSIAEFAEVGMCRWNTCCNSISGTDQWYYNLGIENRKFGNILDAYINAHPDDVVKVQNGFNDLIAGKSKNFRVELRVNSGDNNWKWLRCSYKMSDYRPDENIVEIISINIDITELKNTEIKLIDAKHKAEESDQLKSAFIANMSHEIRTPLNAIVGFSDLLLDESTEVEDRVQYVNIIKQNNDILLQLVSDILDISKIESGMIDIKIGCVDVKALCEDIISVLSINSLVPVILNGCSEKCVMTTDRLRLTQILKNLISNALKFTKEGSVEVGYKSEENMMVFYVRDTGTGIHKEDQKEVFKRFVKVDNFVQGTGLGLPICKSIVEKMGGKIWLESEYGKGACFWFSIPMRIEDVEVE